MNAKEKMYQQIEKHGEQLNAIFNTEFQPVELCKKLRRLENKANRAAVQYCNGVIDWEQMNKITEAVLSKLKDILGESQELFINGDPRGYSLKINNAENLNIYKDWGGYGILAPEFN